MGFFTRSKQNISPDSQKREVPDGQWIKCNECEEIIHIKQLNFIPGFATNAIIISELVVKNIFPYCLTKTVLKRVIKKCDRLIHSNFPTQKNISIE